MPLRLVSALCLRHPSIWRGISSPSLLDTVSKHVHAVGEGVKSCQCPLQHLQFCAGQAKALRIPCSWEHPGKACLSAELPLGFSHPITQVLLTLRDLLGPCIRAGCSLGHVAKKYFKKNSNTACFHIAPSRCSPLVCVFHFLSPVLVYPKDEVALLEGLGLMLRSVFPGWDC